MRMQSFALFTSLSPLPCFHSENNPLACRIPTGTLVPGLQSCLLCDDVRASFHYNRVKQIKHAGVQCCGSRNAKTNLEIFLAKWNILMSISHLKYSPNLLFLVLFCFLAASQGVLYLSWKRKIFLFPVLDLEWH